MMTPTDGIKFTGSAAPVLVFEAEDYGCEANLLCFYSPATALFLWQFTKQGLCYECAGQETLTEFGAGSRSEALDALRSRVKDTDDAHDVPRYVREAAEAVRDFFPPHPRYIPETPADEAAAAEAFETLTALLDELDAAKAEQQAEWEALGEAEQARRMAAEVQAFRDALTLPGVIVAPDTAPSPETPAPSGDDPVPGNALHIRPAY